jgi:hypothetical protein
LSIKALAFDIKNTLPGIEPDHGIVWAVLLRLDIGLKQAQLGRRIICLACSYQSCE